MPDAGHLCCFERGLANDLYLSSRQTAKDTFYIGSKEMGLILLLIVLVLLFGGGGFYMGPPFHYVGGGLSLIVVIVILVLLFRG